MCRWILRMCKICKANASTLNHSIMKWWTIFSLVMFWFRKQRSLRIHFNCSSNVFTLPDAHIFKYRSESSSSSSLETTVHFYLRGANPIPGTITLQWNCFTSWTTRARVLFAATNGTNVYMHAGYPIRHCVLSASNAVGCCAGWSSIMLECSETNETVIYCNHPVHMSIHYSSVYILYIYMCILMRSQNRHNKALTGNGDAAVRCARSILAHAARCAHVTTDIRTILLGVWCLARFCFQTRARVRASSLRGTVRSCSIVH